MEAFPRAGHYPQKIFINFPEIKTCKNCEKLGVIDGRNIYVSCIECMDWKEKLQEKPSQK